MKTLIFLFSIPILILSTALSGAAAVTDWELLPENPVVGDTVVIKGTASPGEEIDVLVSFEKEVQVSDGKYEYLLEDVKIPGGFDNRFTVQAKGADDLNVRVKMILWLTKSAQASGGTATVSQSRVPPGTYRIMMDGNAGGPGVELRIAALQKVTADPEGKFQYTYSTKSVPAGNFEVNVGGVSEQITLEPNEESMPDLFQDPEQAPEQQGEEENADKEKANDENSFVEEAGKSAFPDENSSKIIGFEGEKSEKGLTYVLQGIAAGVIVLLLYSRLKKPQK